MRSPFLLPQNHAGIAVIYVRQRISGLIVTGTRARGPTSAAEAGQARLKRFIYVDGAFPAMEGGRLSLEIKYIYERTRNRLGRGRTAARAIMDPKVAELPPGDRFLVVSPHQDDDAIGCGGTVIKLRAAGKRVRVAYLSTRPVEGKAPDHRMVEAREALRIMGVDEWSAIGEANPSDDMVRARLREELRGFDPDAVLVPSPIENHAQHVQAFECYHSVLNKDRDRATLLYEVWTPIPVNLLVDITAQIEAKGRAIAAHESQVALIDYVAASKGLATYRAAMSGRKGYAEGFLYLDRGQLNDFFGPARKG
jgi:LmbE family N-acetylglucosaminyl deacetylase